MPKSWNDVTSYFYEDGRECGCCPFFKQFAEPTDNYCKLLDEPKLGDDASLCRGMPEEEE